MASFKEHHANFWIQVASGFFILAVVALISKFKLKKKEEPPKFALPSKKMTKEQFKNFLSPSVKVMAQKTGIPYEFMMAQIALETGWGKSELFWKYNNVGGIRSFHPETEPHVLEWTHEAIKTSDLDNPKWASRDKSKDKKKVKDGVEYTNIYIQLPFRTFPNLVEGLQFYLNKVLLNKYFKNYAKEANGDAYKYVDLLQSGKYGAKYATATNYPETVKGLMKNFV